MMKLSICLCILAFQPTLGDRLTGLIARRVEDAQCNQVCGHLEDYAACRTLCSAHYETKQLLCRLPTCDRACQTACASHAMEHEVQEFTIDGCTLQWKTNTQTKSNSILTGQDYWGRFTVLYEGTGTDQYKLDAQTARQWRQFTVFVVGKSGLESRETIQLDTPVQCSQPSLPLAQPINKARTLAIVGSVIAVVIFMVLIIVMKLAMNCSIKRVDASTAPIPSVAADCCEPKPVFRSQTQHTYEDYKVYEDISFDLKPFNTSSLNSPV